MAVVGTEWDVSVVTGLREVRGDLGACFTTVVGRTVVARGLGDIAKAGTTVVATARVKVLRGERGGVIVVRGGVMLARSEDRGDGSM